MYFQQRFLRPQPFPSIPCAPRHAATSRFLVPKRRCGRRSCLESIGLHTKLWPLPAGFLNIRSKRWCRQVCFCHCLRAWGGDCECWDFRLTCNTAPPPHTHMQRTFSSTSLLVRSLTLPCCYCISSSTDVPFPRRYLLLKGLHTCTHNNYGPASASPTRQALCVSARQHCSPNGTRFAVSSATGPTLEVACSMVPRGCFLRRHCGQHNSASTEASATICCVV